MTTKFEKIILPALRGQMGKWAYYSCLMSLRELASRVKFADEIHKSKELSKMIQRRLTSGRDTEIADYLEKQPERFFNSLVVATYGGEPNWHPLSDVKTGDEGPLAELSEETIASVGFLTLMGTENLFALDGQHRLAGIKKAIAGGVGNDDEVSVIVVAHENSKLGMQRTRRLFTVLNKTARPVSKGDIIALDEDDVMAVCVRRLIEETTLFSGNKIAFVATNNMPTANGRSLTTIGNLYDILTILFTTAKTDLKERRGSLQRSRPSDEKLDQYFKLSETYFTLLKSNFPELKEFFTKDDSSTVVKKHRGSHGGSALFRPLGLDLFTKIVARLSADMSLEAAVKLAAKLPRTLNSAPYEGLLWDNSTRTITTSHNVTLRETLLFMVGASRFKEAALRERYRKETGRETAKLPSKVI